MTTYAAFLRGINVGGHKKVPMAELRAAAEGLGYADVATYINSGNLVFTATEKAARWRRSCRQRSRSRSASASTSAFGRWPSWRRSSPPTRIPTGRQQGDGGVPDLEARSGRRIGSPRWPRGRAVHHRRDGGVRPLRPRSRQVRPGREVQPDSSGSAPPCATCGRSRRCSARAVIARLGLARWRNGNSSCVTSLRVCDDGALVRFRPRGDRVRSRRAEGGDHGRQAGKQGLRHRQQGHGRWRLRQHRHDPVEDAARGGPLSDRDAAARSVRRELPGQGGDHDLRPAGPAAACGRPRGRGRPRPAAAQPHRADRRVRHASSTRTRCRSISRAPRCTAR